MVIRDEKKLKEIAFPIGGIGTGSISLSGKGNLIDWEIFNRPNKGFLLPYSFFTLWVKSIGEKPITKVLQAPASPPFTGSHGLIREGGAGLPHLQSSRFQGEYPFADINFQDSVLPVEVSLEAYNPFIPLNDKDSGLPVAIFYFKITNFKRKEARVSVAANLFNAVGYPDYGKNVNTFVKERNISALYMTSEKYRKDSPRFGSMVLATSWKRVGHQCCWLREKIGWKDWYALLAFWEEFSTTGSLNERKYGPSPEGKSDVGSLILHANLKPGASVTLPFFISWCFPNFEKYWDKRKKKPLWKNYYTQEFKDAFEVARYVAKNEKPLYQESKLFHDSLFSSTLPSDVLEAISSQASILKSTTCLRLEDGTFYGFEGCSPQSGCCEGSCTHVWNYAQTLAFLFPALERSMREADYKYNQFEDGRMCFRLQLPLGSKKSNFLPAADGQMGGMIKLYRDWKLSGDDEWLKSLWTKSKKALEYAWKEWDKDKDGVMEEFQHNTYDVEFLGPNSMMGTFYLCALRAAEEIANYLGEKEKAKEYRRLFEKGRRKIDKELFNGEYYIQKYNPKKAPKYQYGKGCLSDQLIGQWFSHIVGLGYLLNERKVKKALKSILKYNWKTNFHNHINTQRIFALNDEKGLLLCTWPKGGRPRFPFPYCDEVWGGGIDYQVGSHLIFEGLIKQGLSIIKGLRGRYDGERRNPWNEVECGNHYARSLASWALLIALSGFSYDMSYGKIGFHPRIYQDNFRVFWSMGSGWGVFSQKRGKGKQIENLNVLFGEVKLKELNFELPERAKKIEVKLTHLRCEPVGVRFIEPAATWIQKGNEILITLTNKLNLKENKTFQVEISY